MAAADHCIVQRRGKLSLANTVVLIAKGPEHSSVFKEFGEDKIPDDSLYFPPRQKPVRYTRELDEQARRLILENIDFAFASYSRNIEFFAAAFENEEALMEEVKRCAQEILYDKIRKNSNWTTKKGLRCLSAAAAIVALKVILQYDYMMDESSVIKGLSRKQGCSVKIVLRMESDIITTTNWRGCPQVMQRLKQANL